MRRRGLLAVRWVLFLAIGLFLATTGEASRVRTLNLEQLGDSADRVFLGRVSTVVRERDEKLGHPVFRVTFDIERTAKGTKSDSITVKMLDTGSRFPGLTEFTEGEELVLFLYPTSDLGLTSPVALGQGRFRIDRDKAGKRYSVNPYGNRALFGGLSSRAERALRPILSRTDAARVETTTLLDAVETLDADHVHRASEAAEARGRP